MKVVALTNFRDIDDFSKSYVEGESYEFTDKRAKELIGKGLVKELMVVDTKTESKSKK